MSATGQMNTRVRFPDGTRVMAKGSKGMTPEQEMIAGLKLAAAAVVVIGVVAIGLALGSVIGV